MLTASELEDVIEPRAYTDRFQALCRTAAAAAAATYVLMERYAYINGYAGSGVALLAGAIGYQRDLFLDRAGGSNPDRGMKIAAKIFMATIDEHGGPRGLGPHRSMAQACVDKVAEYANLDEAARATLDAKPQAFIDVVDQFKSNYAAAGRDPASLLRAIGYHIASEYLADMEYQILDEDLWHKNPDENFRAVVRRTRTENGWGGPWSWITVHGHYGEAENDDGHGVEEEHFQGALDAALLIEKYPPVAFEPSETHRLIIEGVLSFRNDFLVMFDLVAVEVEAAASAAIASKQACGATREDGGVCGECRSVAHTHEPEPEAAALETPSPLKPSNLQK